MTKQQKIEKKIEEVRNIINKKEDEYGKLDATAIQDYKDYYYRLIELVSKYY